MKIMESAENYLETIYILNQKTGNVRSVDVANELSFSKPSVSVAMKKFRSDGYVNVDTNGIITLTSKGEAIAKAMYERHHTIAKALMALGVDEENAYADSCKIEHVISNETFEKIKEYMDGLKNGSDK